jgi:DNA-3-methyladenine glycosylase
MREVLEIGVLQAAPLFLGSVLVRGERRARIVEVEAYRADGDPGSHAYRGMTPRNRIMFGPPGFAYVYFTYGSHWMLNITAGKTDEAAALLIRAAEPLADLDTMRANRPKARHDWDLLSGPGKIAAAFEITSVDYGLDLLNPKSSLHFEVGPPPSKILCGPRIGLAQGKGETLPWRFVDGHSLRYISRPHPSETWSED